MTLVFGITGRSGSGKTTLITRMIPLFAARGLSVGVLKHADKSFDIDHPGKDSHRFRAAGCCEVAVSSSRRWAFMHECGRDETEADMQTLLAKFSPECNLVLVEGYKDKQLPKVEVWRKSLREPPLAGDISHIVAVAADCDPPGLPADCQVLSLADPAAVAEFIVGGAKG